MTSPAEIEGFFFRDLHPGLFLGTASDRYAGWCGQIYTGSRYRGRITRRPRKMAGRALRDEILPIECVQEYFEHFRVLEIDSTYYQPLLDEDGQPNRIAAVLESYRQNMSESDCVILKVPQMIFSQKIRKGGLHVRNEAYMDASAFIRQFYSPVTALFGPLLRGFVFEQEYQRVEERVPPEEFASALESFFGAIPVDTRYHVELRTEAYLCESVFRTLAKYGVGQVLSYWTWLPPLNVQFKKASRRFFNSGRQSVIRLMTPLGTRYEQAFAQAHPFDRIIEDMLQPAMISDTISVVREGLGREMEMYVLVNNRAGGNAPLIAKMIAEGLIGSGSIAGS